MWVAGAADKFLFQTCKAKKKTADRTKHDHSLRNPHLPNLFPFNFPPILSVIVSSFVITMCVHEQSSDTTPTFHCLTLKWTTENRGWLLRYYSTRCTFLWRRQMAACNEIIHSGEVNRSVSTHPRFHFWKLSFFLYNYYSSLLTTDAMRRIRRKTEQAMAKLRRHFYFQTRSSFAYSNQNPRNAYIPIFSHNGNNHRKFTAPLQRTILTQDWYVLRNGFPSNKSTVNFKLSSSSRTCKFLLLTLH